MSIKRSFTRSLLGTALGAGLFFAVAGGAFAAFDDGVRAYLSHDYETALEHWRPLADDGHPSAQFGLGLAYENGRGVERDLTEAANWYRRAADQGLTDAQFNLGNLYLTGAGVTQNAQEAVRWFRKAAEQDMPHAQVNLGYSYETGSGVERDPAAAVLWYRKAAEQNFSQAQYYLGAAYERGVGVDRSVEAAAEWYERAAAQGVALAQSRLDAMAEQERLLAEADAAEVAAVEPAAGTPDEEMEAAEIALVEPEAGTPSNKPDMADVADVADVAEETATEMAAETADVATDGEIEMANADSLSATAAPGDQVDSLVGSHRVRLASYREANNAQDGWRILRERFADMLGPLNFAVSRADLGPDKGIYYRLEAGPLGSAQEASSICKEIGRAHV